MGTVVEKFTYLEETKDAIKTAILQQGGVVSEETPFRQYAQAILDLEAGGEEMEVFSVSPLVYETDPVSWKGFQVGDTPNEAQMLTVGKAFIIYFGQDDLYGEYTPFMGYYSSTNVAHWSREVRFGEQREDESIKAKELWGRAWLLKYDGTYFRTYPLGVADNVVTQEIIEPGVGGYYNEYNKVCFVKQGNIVHAFGGGHKWGGTGAASFVSVPDSWAPERSFTWRGGDNVYLGQPIAYPPEQQVWPCKITVDSGGTLWLGWEYSTEEYPYVSPNDWYLDGMSWVIGYSGAEGGGGKCFAGNTQVATPTGRKSIGSVEKGDIILSYDHKEDKLVEAEVTNLKSSKEKEFYVLTTVDGKQIKATRGHRFFIMGIAYQEIEMLRPGQKIMTNEMKFVEIKSIEKVIEKETTVYDISTAFGTYYVGDDKILVRSGNDLIKEK